MIVFSRNLSRRAKGVAKRRLASCSSEYRTESLGKTYDERTRVLYAVGGLYGNVSALDTLAAVVKKDVEVYGDVTVVFNGDFNFFNVDQISWQRINREIKQDFTERTGSKTFATKGNIEHEVAKEISSSCGCAYPENVDPLVSDRARAIVERLRKTAHSDQAADWIIPWLHQLPWSIGLTVHDVPVLLVHGDPDCVNGWSLAADANTSPSILEGYFDQTNASIIACTHTCRAHLTQIPQDGRIVINNGAAGLSNFHNSTAGLVSRIAHTDSPPLEPSLSAYTSSIANVRTDSIYIHFDTDAWLRNFFLPNWPPTSPAHTSYYNRITSGVSDWTPTKAERGFLSAALCTS